jgi:predicted Rossmann fold flavoprotein
MLVDECEKANIIFLRGINVQNIKKDEKNYFIELIDNSYSSSSLVIATGGLSIPKIGATKFGYEIAKKFNLDITPLSAALVPLTFSDNILAMCRELTGISQDAIVSYGKTFFKEGMLFTHRGLSGPSILQISSYWKLTNEININLCPEFNVFEYLSLKKISNSKQDIISSISEILPKRLAVSICNHLKINGRISEISNKILLKLSSFINSWSLKPTGTEGYRTAEVTLGGINTNELSSKTMMSKKHEGLFFIGEVVDVTGHLGGYNFQWAWSSGYVAGQYT